MNKKELKEKVYRHIEDQDDDLALHLLYDAAMAYGKLDRDILDMLTPIQLRRLDKSIRQAEDRELVPDDEEMKEVRLLVASHVNELEDEAGLEVVREPDTEYELSDEMTPQLIARLKRAREQIKNGEVYTHQEVQQKVKEWLSK